MKVIKVGIDGLGGSGGCVYRILMEREGVEVAAINDVADPKALAYLLKFDTVMGRLDADVHLEGEVLQVGAWRTRMLNVKEPPKLPCKPLPSPAPVHSTG